jgi:chromosome segregation ATPase
MTSTDGLDIQQVQDQWKESQRLLDDVRSRLESLASTSASAAESTNSIRASEKLLADLANGQRDTAQALEEAQASAVKTLTAVTEVAANTDIGRLGQQLTTLESRLTEIHGDVRKNSGTTETIKKDLDAVKVEQAEQKKTMSELLAALNGLVTTLDSAVTAKDEVSKKDAELAAFRTSVDRAVSAIPSRYQSRFRDALK